MNLAEITKDLSNLSLRELRDLNKIIVAQINQKQTLVDVNAANNFSIGDQVSWVSSKSGKLMVGKIIRCNVKTATVMVGLKVGLNQRWSVSWSFLKKVEAA